MIWRLHGRAREAPMFRRVNGRRQRNWSFIMDYQSGEEMREAARCIREQAPFDVILEGIPFEYVDGLQLALGATRALVAQDIPEVLGTPRKI